jgi:acyl-CoA thioester hydrolase
MKQFECTIALRWGDMDAMGHLNNTVYFRLIEEARIQWFNQVGIVTSAQQEGPILAHASCDFLKPMTYPATAVVVQTVTRIGRASVTLDCEIHVRQEPGVVFAKCKSVVVWMDYRTGKSAPWPDAIRAAME